MHFMLWIIYTLQLRIISAVILTKCCPQNQQLNNKGICVPLEEAPKKENLEWFPREAFVSYDTLKVLPENELNETMAELRRSVQVRYDNFPDCEKSIKIVANNDDFHLVVNKKNVMSAIVRIYDYKVISQTSKESKSQSNNESTASDTVSSDVKANATSREKRQSQTNPTHLSVRTRQLLLPMALVCMDSVRDWHAPFGLAFCSSTPYVPKCCPLRYIYNKTTGSCQKSKVDDWLPEAEKDEQTFPMLAHRNPTACNSVFHSETDNFCDGLPQSYPRYTFLPNGSAMIYQRHFRPNEYCGEKTFLPGFGLVHHDIYYCQNTFHSQVIYPPLSEFSVVANKVTMITSSTILVVTVIVFLLLPSLRSKLHEKVTLVHLMTFTIGDIVWTLELTVNISDRATLFGITILMQFFYVASFTWLNVMCYDMSSKIGAQLPPAPSTSREEWWRFFKMSLYAWALPLIFLLYHVGMMYVDFPNYGDLRPWTVCASTPQREIAQSYFYMYPILITLIPNVVMYGYAIRKIVVVTRETAVLRTGDSATTGTTSSKSDKQRLIVFTKLLLLMGLSFVFEMIAWKYEWISSTASVISNAIHFFRATTVFIMYVCRKTVWHGLLQLFTFKKSDQLKQKLDGKINGGFVERSSEPTLTTYC